MSSFFFSSRRRHTILQGDWSSDVCSSDLRKGGEAAQHHPFSGRSCPYRGRMICVDRKSVVEGKSVDIGGGRIIKKKKKVGGVGRMVGGERKKGGESDVLIRDSK